MAARIDGIEGRVEQRVPSGSVTVPSLPTSRLALSLSRPPREEPIGAPSNPSFRHAAFDGPRRSGRDSGHLAGPARTGSNVRTVRRTRRRSTSR